MKRQSQGTRLSPDELIHVGRPNIGSQERFNSLVSEIFDRRWLTNNGPLVQELEGRIAKFIGVRHCIAVCNGTIALEIAIRALGLSDEVIIPSYTFVATAHALHWQGITPVFADIDPRTHNIDPASVRRLISPRTTGIIGVHLWGRGAAVDELQSIADEHGIALLFDAAHAFGCSHHGQMIGSFGRAEVLSFHATKFFNTFEGGAVVTNDDELANTMRLMRNFGFSGFDNVIHPGTNGKMIEVCAAMGLVNLESIDDVIQANKRNYCAYRNALQALPEIVLLPYSDAERNNYQYVILEVAKECTITRDEIVAVLHEHGILARKYFWPGCHRMQPYRNLFPNVELTLPHTEEVANRVIVMPTGTTLSVAQVENICELIRRAIH